jgi:GNAT superfamily N-acetyltransferase
LGRGGEAATRRLAEHLASARASLPGVIGPRETVDAFVQAWSERSDTFGKLARLQTLYELRTLEPSRVPPGRLSEARPEHEKLLASWSIAFQDEVGVYVGVGADARAFVHAKVDAGQLFVWENGGPVTMAGWAARTSRAVRVNYVYTPPAERRKGYASACVAALSQKLLDEGSETCVLFADAANSTSNGIYQRLGYRPSCEFAHYDFVSR